MKLTREALEEAFDRVRRQGTMPRHDCRLDGHIEHFCSERCGACGELIRQLEPVELQLHGLTVGHVRPAS
jgi:hypothetical protein